MREEDYKLDFFKDNGFERKNCVSCGRHFWTLSEIQTCGDAPCNEYSFIDCPPTNKKYTLREMRELYLNFFEKKGHTRIGRYPIVARWREDVFFTQASIYDFQPWVIEEVVKPPANPLTISQPCVRFNDIDNVGRTGRHFTMFEMMAHHAFNTKKDYVYFKEKTVGLCHELLIKELGINPGKITYIEKDWSGGGNAGPCFEVLVDGNELATLVFMICKVDGEKLLPMSMQVVDTGYGLERFTWLSQGTPNAYEAVFGDVLTKLKSEAKVETSDYILSEYSKVAGLLSAETVVDLKTLRKIVAERLNLNVNDLISYVTPLENLYIICDHTRALIFILNDGVVPSNVKTGYFARMLVRRCLRALNDLKLSIPILEIVKMQLKTIERDFPELKENSEDILRLIEEEERKYKETLLKGKETVSKLVNNLRHEGKELTLDHLIELYDSHGLTPEVVQEFAKLKLSIPSDFYIRVAKRHEMPDIEIESKLKIPENLPPTSLAYYRESKQIFQAKVVAIFENNIVLDATYFYPEGGGEESDRGKIEDLDVVNVKKIGNVVLHQMKNGLTRVKIGDIVSCQIDWDRRLQLTRHHTATHIVNGAARKVLGNHVWQTGAHKSIEIARLDLTHYAALTQDELKEIERLANRVVMMNKKINISFMERTEAEKKYGFRLYQGGVVPGKEIRVIDIPEWDVEACGGTHCNATGDVGPIKILRSQRIQDGVVRLEFLAGEAALRYFRERDETLSKIEEIPYIQPTDLIKSIETLALEKKDREKREEVRTIESIKSLVDDLIKNAEIIKGVKLVTYIDTLDSKKLLSIGKEFGSRKGLVALIGSAKEGAKLIFVRSSDVNIDCATLMKKAVLIVGGTGGGKSDFGQGGGPVQTKLSEAIAFAKDNVKKFLKVKQ